MIETSSIFWLAANQPAAAFGIAGFLCAGAAAQIALVRRRPDIGTGLATAFIVLAACLALLADQAHALRLLARGPVDRRVGGAAHGHGRRFRARS